VLLRAYCDESTMGEGGRRVLTVGAVIGPQSSWEHFDSRWAAVLSEHGVDVFHTTDYENASEPQPPYDDRGFWTKERRIGFMASLIDAMTATDPHFCGVSCSVDLDEFESVLSPSERRKFGSPYTFCSIWIMNTVSAEIGKAGALVGEPLDLQVAYVFEKGPGQGRLEHDFRHAEAFIASEKNLAPGGFAAMPKESFTPLQAADLFTFEASKEALRELGAHHRSVRKSFAAMRECGISMYRLLFRGDTIRDIYEKLESGEAYMPEWNENKNRRPRRPKA